MTIQLYNSATRKKEPFEPIDPANVRMYVCGPTVYDRAHLGNARPVIVFDVLNRLLRHTYGDEHVTYVRNFTDVDDKINATALARQEAGAEGTLEELVRERSDETIAWYHADMDALGAARPDQEPRATEYIGQMIAMIAQLEQDGFAYAKDGHVLFRVRKYDEYGKLSGRSVDDMIAGARVEVAPFKEDPMDFVLWKPSDDALPGWDSPWGRGRPGWHIECSAMAADLLGEAFDIHGGGLDLQFPHHENEIAQSKCAGHGFARYWLHNEMLQVEGKKMSKSLGNFFTVRDLLDEGVPGEVIRFVMLSTHYRKPMDWTEKKREEAEKTLRKIAELFAQSPMTKPWPSGMSVISDEIVEAVSDDLNTSLALTILRKYLRNREENKLRGALTLLGFEPDLIRGKYAPMTASAFGDERVGSVQGQSFGADGSSNAEGFADIARKLRDLRNAAMQSKDFSAVDELKAALLAAGVEVRMSKDGVDLQPKPDFDPSKLEGLL